jgi:predicted nucleic acid-binding protein
VNAYVDTSVLLRIVLGQPGALAGWSEITRAVTSALTEVECLRTLDRLTLTGALRAGDAPARRAAVYDVLEGIELVDVSRPVLARASQPLPTALGTLDAIHLATALLWRDQGEGPITIATHDVALGTAARAMGFDVAGA